MRHLYGKRPVMERLQTAPKTIRALYFQETADAAEIIRMAKKVCCTFRILPKRAFAKLAGDVHAQGVLAEVEGFQYTALKDLLEKRPLPILFFLDRLTDPQNLGAILRSMACLGGVALVLPKHDSVEVNDTVLRVACGGENYVPVSLVTNLAQASELAKKAGYWLAGAVPSGGTPLHKVSWPETVGVILGSEGSGIRPGLAKHVDFTVTLPMQGADLSFNVATAAALIAYEITRSRLK